jgi:DNA-binding PadR family transcriptional regulator
VADKLTQQIVEALARAAAEPAGLPLYSSKSEPGPFPNASSAKPAAQKCLADDLIRTTGPGAGAKNPRDLYGLTERGWEFLLAAVNPRQVLEDFVRVLEVRQGEVGELLATARRMADSLHGLKEAVARVLPTVSEARVQKLAPTRYPSTGADALFSIGPAGASAQASPGATPLNDLQLSEQDEGGVGVLCQVDLAPTILARLAGHRGPTDCTLPELFRALAAIGPAPSIGEFHDCLRALHADGALALHSWTGPLYALPEPQFALLVGHGIAYYASLKG